jgi:hypothetical protein
MAAIQRQIGAKPASISFEFLRQVMPCLRCPASRICCRASCGVDRKTFSFCFLLILDEGGLREGWVKTAYSSLAATESCPGSLGQGIITNSHTSYAGRSSKLVYTGGTGRAGPPVPPGYEIKMVSVAGAAEFYNPKSCVF